MFSFLKSSVTVTALGEGVSDSIRRRFASGWPGNLFPDWDSTPHSNFLNEEWLYLEIFSFDFTSFVALGETPTRRAIMDHFYLLLGAWLKTWSATPTPERQGFFANKLTTMPPECSEIAYERMLRRLSLYSEAAKSPHPNGTNYVVASTFAALCGTMDIAFIVGISGWFSTGKIETSKMLKSFKIVIA